jgi:hypothetical protein
MAAAMFLWQLIMVFTIMLHPPSMVFALMPMSVDIGMAMAAGSGTALEMAWFTAWLTCSRSNQHHWH